MRRLKLFSWQFYTHGNYGDTVLAEAVHYLFHGFAKGSAYRFEDGADLRYPIGSALVARANALDAGVLCGGGPILPRNLDVSGWTFNATRAVVSQMRRSIVFGVGYNYYAQHKEVPALFKANFEALIENSPFVGMRNHGSIERIKEVVDRKYHSRIHFQPCPTTFLRELVDEFDAHAVPSREKRVALQISLFAGNTDVETVKGQVTQAVQSLRATGFSVELLSFMDKIDTEIASYLAESGVNDLRVTSFNTQGNDVLLGTRVAATLPITVATRGHGAMVPFGAGSTVIPINLAPKLAYFAADANIAQSMIDPSHPNLGDEIVRKVTDAYERLAELQADAAAHRQRFYEVSIDNLSRIYHSLTGVTIADRELRPLSEFEVEMSAMRHRARTRLEQVTRGGANVTPRERSQALALAPPRTPSRSDEWPWRAWAPPHPTPVVSSEQRGQTDSVATELSRFLEQQAIEDRARLLRHVAQH